MTDSVMEISEDYDLSDEMNSLETDYCSINRLENQFSQIEDAAAAVQMFGMNQSAFGVMKATDLLSGTALEALTMESFYLDDPDGHQRDMALEALGEKFKEKMIAWSGRILHFATEMNARVSGLLEKMWDKISTQVKILSTKAWDQTKAAGKVIKAHPYKSVAVALTAAAAVGTIIAYTGTSGGVYANESALKSFVYKIRDMIDRINWPFGKMNVEVVNNGTKIVYRYEKGAELVKLSETPVKLGWTQSAVKSVGGQTSRAWVGLKSGLSNAGVKLANGIKTINNVGDPGAATKNFVADKTGSQLTGWASQQVMNKIYTGALWAVVGVLYCLLKDIVLKAFQMVKDSLRSLNPVLQTA